MYVDGRSSTPRPLAARAAAVPLPPAARVDTVSSFRWGKYLSLHSLNLPAAASTAAATAAAVTASDPRYSRDALQPRRATAG
ncbi:hypothetical protein PLESTB_000261900 [Pleodorina starrii]|uniref:Uncharacterized protein n=1 Tax=Pleodorina starrii TaxID=330485 RepID=A0A9W6EYZ4_9CHLO|nr:hypothetical protein PLESTM_000689100 [Pleodorina starrii]GLC49591.1 hypothetical protein PLESTB_000261900 [Pleodorina starrii]GLC65619.1 hypothetical protein PLESTF_000319600 [Pleodorina starrii]